MLHLIKFRKSCRTITEGLELGNVLMELILEIVFNNDAILRGDSSGAGSSGKSISICITGAVLLSWAFVLSAMVVISFDT